MKWLAITCLFICSCTAIKNATYPSYVDMQFVDDSADKGAWMCVRNSEQVDRIDCLDLRTFVDSIMDFKKGQKPETIRFSVEPPCEVERL